MEEQELLKDISKRVANIEHKLNILISPRAQLRERLLTIKDVMIILGVSRNTVYKYKNMLGGIKMPGGWRFKRELIERFKIRGNENEQR